jgi:hypothetical protein
MILKKGSYFFYLLSRCGLCTSKAHYYYIYREILLSEEPLPLYYLIADINYSPSLLQGEE